MKDAEFIESIISNVEFYYNITIFITKISTNINEDFYYYTISRNETVICCSIETDTEVTIYKTIEDAEIASINWCFNNCESLIYSSSTGTL